MRELQIKSPLSLYLMVPNFREKKAKTNCEIFLQRYFSLLWVQILQYESFFLRNTINNKELQFRTMKNLNFEGILGYKFSQLQ